MITSNITTNQDLPQIGQKAHLNGPGYSRPDNVKKEVSLKDAGQGWDKINKDNFPFSKLQASNFGINRAAQSIRIADRAMEKIDTFIDRMKDELQIHVKNYPPFLSGRKERFEMNRDIVVEHKGFSKTIHSRQVHTGHSGLDIPELSGHAGDHDIHLMIKKLDFAKDTLIKRRAGLAADASDIMNPPGV
ncbi:MAG: hypothetical protein JRI92_10070 [Deltaproteobacteria bacterium]|nr:hypothetical protein [Deltaproteobacteria bacterium]